jgi:hypothetical protein
MKPGAVKKIVLFFSIVIASILSCEPEIKDPIRIFVIKKGDHYSTYSVEMLDRRILNFRVMFDSSAIYDFGNQPRQSAINKLLGISDCNNHHHENSARFGWQWYHNRLEILAYTYVNGERIEKYIGEVSLNEYHQYSIAIEKDLYIFRLDNYPAISMKRGETCDVGAYYMLFPYFGGQDTAPHDIYIYVKMYK